MGHDIIFTGCRGYTNNYGGWETFVQNLIDNWKNKEDRFFVFELVHEKEKEFDEVVNGVTCIRIYVKQTGMISMVFMDIKMQKRLRSVMEKYNIHNPILYILSARVGIYVWAFRNRLKKLGAIIVHNPAGLEWKRTKWNHLVRFYGFISHYLQAKATDYLVCDSEAMVDVYDNLIIGRRPVMRYIAYGSYEVPAIADNPPEKVKEYFSEHGIVPDNYYLVLGRFVPENNYELIIKEFMESDTKRDLILICNHNKESKFYNKLHSKIRFDQDKRIKFIGSMYDKEVLNYVRQLAHGYIHGHSVGGTNPGLLEAMSATSLNLLYDVVFNKQVGGECALYFNESNKLRDLIAKCDNMRHEEIMRYGARAKDRMKDLYSWEKIVSEYKDLFDEIYCNENIDRITCQ